jgi:cellulose 1,4-beta-cellobiosidase
MYNGSGMQWLDASYPTTADPSAPGVARGPCSSGDTTMLTADYPNAGVTFSNAKIGEVRSTYARS